VNSVPFVFLFAFRYITGLSKEMSNRSALLPLAATIVVFAHLVPFGVATRRHLDWPNFRQERLANLSEELTNAQVDPVYDGIGLVNNRPIIHRKWFLHSMNVDRFWEGPGPKLRDMLADRPAPIFIPSYRTDWLPEEDHEFIRERYVPLADDFWVFGKVLPPGGGTFEVVHPGRNLSRNPGGADGTSTGATEGGTHGRNPE
jgi:hypothetical protein